ncbi:MAG: DUF6797 domain-containing protein [Verrucomicrobiota bacterium]
MKFLHPFPLLLFSCLLCVSPVPSHAAAKPPPWIVYNGYDMPGYGRKIVLIAGDQELRSEESLPQLAKILAQHQGFHCTVLFPQNPAQPGLVNPAYGNIPGLRALKTADLLIIGSPLDQLPKAQQKQVQSYLTSGRPVVGLLSASFKDLFEKANPQDTYQLPNGQKGRLATLSPGSQIDLSNQETRTNLINNIRWTLGIDPLDEDAIIDVVEDFTAPSEEPRTSSDPKEKNLPIDSLSYDVTVDDPYLETPPEVPFLDVTKNRKGYDFADHPRNRFRLYDYYQRQADWFLNRPERPDLLPAYPGIDGGAFGHWGRYPKNSFTHRSWNLMDHDAVFSGILRLAQDRRSKETTPRAIAFKLGDDEALSASFDTQTLRFAHLWEDGFIGFFPNRYGIGGGMYTDGALLLQSPNVAGWSKSPSFPKSLPKDGTEYHGHYRSGNRAVLKYTVDGVTVLDSPWAIETPAGPAFTRTLNFLSESPSPRSVLLFSATPGMTTATPEGIIVTADDKATVVVADQRLIDFSAHGELSVRLDKIKTDDRLSIKIWHGPAKNARAALKALAKQSPPSNLEEFTNGGPAKWEWTFSAPGKLGKSRGPFAIDRIPVPDPHNPYGSLMLIGGHDFFSNGDAAVCTMMGDVWRVTGLDDTLENVTWKRIATGLNQALGLTIVDDVIYVLGRDRINRLHDLNGNGEIDFYENFSDAFETSGGGHDFFTGLQRTGDGHWVFSAAGRVVKISPDGKTSTDIASGLRNSNGIAANKDNIILTSTNEGDWAPTNMVMEVREGDFYGRRAKDNQTIDPPLAFIPRGIDNSTGGQLFVDHPAWAALDNQVLSFSFGAGTWYLILRSETHDRPQGAIVPLPGDFASGAHRARFNNADGHLYVTGAEGWGNYALTQGSFDRIRLTQKPLHLPTAWKAHTNGISVTFSDPVDPASLAADNALAQQWNYEYSQGYGSAEYSVKKPNDSGHDVVPVTSTHLLPDGKTVFFEMPEIQPVMQMHLHAALHDHDGTPFNLNLFPTLLHLDEPFTDFDGYTPHKKDKIRDLTLRVRYPVPEQPEDKEKIGPPGRPITIVGVAGLRFDTTDFKVAPGERISLTFDNQDTIPHNLVIIKPGTTQTVGELSNQLMTDPTAYEKHYIPDSSDVLHHTRIIEHSKKHTIHFNAPEIPGQYPYICTFPGHWMIMKGVMIVE